ncbi:MAG: Ig-like domain-containing protein [Halioglobus sp.]|nr:Ig-like domain-containing protein [Halioglobus sp.]
MYPGNFFTNRVLAPCGDSLRLFNSVADRDSGAFVRGRFRPLGSAIVASLGCLLAGAPSLAAPPEAFDVFASSLKSTDAEPRSARIVFDARDPDGDSLTISLVSEPAHGTVELQGAAATYQPDSGFVGVDTFQYEADDQTSTSAAKTVRIRVVDPFGYVPVAPDVFGEFDTFLNSGIPVAMSEDGRTVALSGEVGSGDFTCPDPVGSVFTKQSKVRIFSFDDRRGRWKRLEEGKFTSRQSGSLSVTLAMSADGRHGCALGDRQNQNTVLGIRSY